MPVASQVPVTVPLTARLATEVTAPPAVTVPTGASAPFPVIVKRQPTDGKHASPWAEVTVRPPPLEPPPPPPSPPPPGCGGGPAWIDAHFLVTARSAGMAMTQALSPRPPVISRS